jgi:hypothetical protein
MRRWSLVVGLMSSTPWLAACELVTLDREFIYFEGYCNECSDSGLKRAPCPAGSDAPDLDAELVFAARRALFVQSPDTPTPGLDMDCSAAAAPTRCRPRVETPSLPWAEEIQGIDNAMSTRIFQPFQDLATESGLGQLIDFDYTDGVGGQLLVLRDFNGTEDDPSVRVSFYASPGVSQGNGPPRWDGTDRWDRYELGGSPEPFLRIEDAEGYVADGTLVVDQRGQGLSAFRIDAGTGRPFRLFVRDVLLVGRVDEDGMEDVVFSAVVDHDAMLESAGEAAEALGACYPEAVPAIEVMLVDMLAEAADMPSADATSADQPCGGVSMAFSLSGRRARLGGFSAPLPTQCAP